MVTYCFSSLFLLCGACPSLNWHFRVNRRSKRVEREPKRVGAAGLVALSMRQSVSPVLSTPDADRRSSHREPLNRTRGLEGHGAVGLVKLRPDSSRAALEQSRASVASRARFVGWTRGPFARYISPKCWSHMSAQSKGNRPLTGSQSVQNKGKKDPGLDFPSFLLHSAHQPFLLSFISVSPPPPLVSLV